MEGMGKLLISGSGKGHKALATWWIAVCAGCGILAVVSCVLANKYGIDEALRMWGYNIREASKNDTYYIFMGIAALSVALAPIWCYFMHTRISRTEINVHENSINGLSVVPAFPLSFFLYCSLASLRLADYQLAYDLISSVDVVDGNTLVINTRDTKHKVYAMNAREIRDTIMAQKTKIGYDVNKLSLSANVGQASIQASSASPTSNDVVFVYAGDGICPNCKKPLDASSKEIGLCNKCGFRL